jgi:hypothetical protein
LGLMMVDLLPMKMWSGGLLFLFPHYCVKICAVYSLGEAQRMTSVYAKMEYGVKRLLWLGGWWSAQWARFKAVVNGCGHLNIGPAMY